MNRHFINIKVDREERPDVDRVYVSACVCLCECVTCAVCARVCVCKCECV